MGIGMDGFLGHMRFCDSAEVLEAGYLDHTPSLAREEGYTARGPDGYPPAAAPDYEEMLPTSVFSLI